MKMAKADKADLDAAAELAGALESFERYGYFPGEDGDQFDIDNAEHCQRAMHLLLDIAGKGSIFRVVMGAAVMLDPRNKLVDPDADTIEHHPERERDRVDAERWREVFDKAWFVDAVSFAYGMRKQFDPTIDADEATAKIDAAIKERQS